MRASYPTILKAARLALCLAWAAVMAWLLTGGRYLSFLAPNYWVLLAVGIASMVAFVAALLVAPSAHLHGRGCGPLLSAAICAVPLAFLAANPQPAPDSFSLTSRTSLERLWRTGLALTGGDGLDGEPLDPNQIFVPRLRRAPGGGEGPVVTRVSDLFGLYPENVGSRVEIEATVARPGDLPPGCFVAFRFSITCCAADAAPAAALAYRADGAAPPADTWVRITGTVGQAVHKGIQMPVVCAETVTAIPQPRNPYEN